MSARGARWLTFGALVSSVMVVLGAFVLIRLIVRAEAPLTGTPMLDVAFGLFFIARGVIHFWTARRRSRL